jgi:hypothetical protein
MVLSIMVGNGAQLCAMVGVTLGEFATSYCNVMNTLFTNCQSSLCWASFPHQIVVHLALS